MSNSSKKKPLRILVLTKRQYMAKDLLNDRYGRMRELPLALAERGNNVRGICFSYRRESEGVTIDRAPHNTGRDGGVRVEWHSFNLGGFWASGIAKYIRQSVRVAKEFRPDVIWACSDAYHAIYGVWLARRIGVKCVVDLYDNFESYKATHVPGVLGRFRQAVREADGVTCVSKPLHQFVKESYGRSENTIVLENGTRTDLFYARNKSECRKQLGLPDKGKVVGTAGALTKNRGIETLFAAFEILRQGNPDVRLAVAGPREGKVRWSRDDGIYDLGNIPFEDVPTLLNALDVAIISNKDSDFGRFCFPQKAYEIIACHVPVVAASVGAMNELLLQYPQSLFPPGDARALADAIQRQLANPVPCVIPVRDWTWLSDMLEAFLFELVGSTQSQSRQVDQSI